MALVKTESMSKEAVNVALLNRQDQIQRSAELIMEKTRDWQVIKQFLCNRLSENFLTPAQEEKLKRYQYIYNQLVSGKYTETEVVSQLTNPQLFNIGSTQAYDDIAATKEIFPSFININKRFEIIVQLQINRDMLRKASELCDLKAYAALEKNRTALLALVEEDEAIPGELFEGHQLEAVFNPALLGVPEITKEDMKSLLQELNDKRKVKIKTDFIEDIPHEDVK